MIRKENAKLLVLLLIATPFFVSCANRSNKANKNFLKEFKEEIDNINKKRESRIKTPIVTKPSIIQDKIPLLPQISINKLPQDMFVINYNLYNFPNSYDRVKLSFDDIAIPNSDVFGIKTKLGEKNYQLISYQILQKNIDTINKLSTQEDKQITLELIRQEKNKKRLEKQLNE
jgi:hypothetical protein